MRHPLAQMLTVAALTIVLGPFSQALVQQVLAQQVLAQDDTPVELRILAINDFHGNLRPPPGGIRIASHNYAKATPTTSSFLPAT